MKRFDSIPVVLSERARALRDHRFTPWVLALLVTVVVATLSYTVWRDTREVPLETVPVYAERLEARRAMPTRVVYGTLDPIRQSAIAASMAGVVAEVHVQPGETVKEGQLLVEIDPADANAQATIASAGVSEAQLRSTQTAQELRRARALHSAGAISRSQLDAAIAAHKAADFAMRAARARSSAAWRGVRYSEVRAPFSGTVITRSAELGEAVAPMRPILVLVDDAKLSAELSLAPDEAAHVPVGASVPIVIGSGADRKMITGKVARVSRAVDPRTRRIPIWIEVDNKSSRMAAAGVLAEFHVPIGQPRETLTVPQKAVFDRWSKQFVFVAQDGVAHLRQIEAGDVLGKRREVDSGLSSGEIVIYDGIARLVDGTLVRFVPDPERAAQAGAAANVPTQPAGAPAPAQPASAPTQQSAAAATAGAE